MRVLEWNIAGAFGYKSMSQLVEHCHRYDFGISSEIVRPLIVDSDG